MLPPSRSLKHLKRIGLIENTNNAQAILSVFAREPQVNILRGERRQQEP